MIPLIETTLRAMTGVIGKALLTEIWSAPWGNPLLKAIDGLGVALGTHTGSQRSRNEDRVAVAQITALSREQFAVAMVCDGVGGSEMGDVAATLSIATFLDELTQVKIRLPLSKLIVELIRKMDDVVRSELGGHGTTTASIVLASSTGEFVAANVGDSRIFSWNPGGSRLQQVSVDDTIENELRDLPVKDASVLDARGLRGRLSQAIGEAGRSSNDLRIVVFERNQFAEGGVILATDGAWKSDEIGFKSIAQHATVATDAMRRVLTFAAWTGGVDNVSIVAIEDLLKFAKASEKPAHLTSQAAWATVWICDTKFVMCDSTCPITDVRRQVESRSVLPKSAADKKKPKRKTQSRRKTFSPSPNQDGQQLNLMVNSDTHDRQRDVRQRVEISTDDDDASKTQ